VGARKAVIENSLAAAAERIGDPAPLIYRRLFATRPEVVPLFSGDASGSIRGEMLARAIDVLLDFVGDQGFATNFLRAERENHAGFGVEPGLYMTFFDVIFEVLSEEMGADWSAEVRQTWAEVLAGMRAGVG
jgi:hemoglobin-like flavoprotein